MSFWFAGTSVVLVWLVFRSPALDYRLVMLGAVLPVGEVVFGGPKLAHTLVFAVTVLAVCMLATRNRRLVRRQLLGIPIGLMMHLVLSASWAQAELFWWPLFGFEFPAGPLPELDRPLGVIVLLDLIGVAAIVWWWRAFELDDPENRQRFWRTGQLPRHLEV